MLKWIKKRLKSDAPMNNISNKMESRQNFNYPIGISNRCLPGDSLEMFNPGRRALFAAVFCLGVWFAFLVPSDAELSGPGGASPAPQPLVLFMHLHKTSGTHLGNIMEQLLPEQVCRLREDSASEDDGEGFSIDGRRYLAHVCHNTARTKEASVRILKLALADRAKSNCGFIKAHWDASMFVTHIQPHHPTFVFTIMRDPLTRMLSSYVYTSYVTRNMGNIGLVDFAKYCYTSFDSMRPCLYGG
jgi:hypothetical protein